MILAFDIGNTNTVIGGFDGDELSFVATVATNLQKTSDEYASTLRGILSLHQIELEKIEGAIISSVVPPLNATMKKALRVALNIEALLVGPGVKTGLNIHCDVPSSVGSDLICASAAASKIYGFPVLVIDMGTSTNIMAVDKKGTFIGVSIAPGVNVSLKALTENTAQLPQISLEAPRSVIGKNTADSMRSGVIFGTACMLDGMIDRFNSELGGSIKVISTGEFAESIVPHCQREITLDPYLTLKGLNLIYKKNN